jgi:peptidoglycan/LPS O-acetylase OafA/YrhL
MNLRELLKRGNNNFDLIRLLAACGVIIGHAYAIVPSGGRHDFVASLLPFDYAGSLSVYVFFMLSGMLVTASYIDNSNPLRFTLARVFRIYPALIICLLLSAFAAGPLFTKLSVHDYFSGSGANGYFYHNLSLNNMQWELPAVFQTHIYKSVNGSLWTLPLEMHMYMLVLCLGLSGVFARTATANFALTLIAGLTALYHGKISAEMFSPECLITAAFFIAGGLFAINRDRVFITGRTLLILCLALVPLKLAPQLAFRLGFYIVLIYGTLWVAGSRYARNLKLPGDYSYGIYIYGFIAQQIVAELFPARGPHFNIALALPSAVLLGMLSWHIVEKRALAYGKDLSALLCGLFATGTVKPAFKILIAQLKPLAVYAVLIAAPFLLVRGYSNGVYAQNGLLITAFGPTPVKAGVVFNPQPNGEAAMWIKTANTMGKQAEIIFDGNPLESTVYDDHITAFVPKTLYDRPGAYPVYIRELHTDHYEKSPTVTFNVY